MDSRKKGFPYRFVFIGKSAIFLYKSSNFTDRAASISKLFSNQDHFDAPRNAAPPCDDDLVADAVRGQAVGTYAGRSAGGMLAEPFAVHRSGGVMYAA